MTPRLIWDDHSLRALPADELSARHLRHMRDMNRVTHEHEGSEFARAAKRPQELELLEFAP